MWLLRTDGRGQQQDCVLESALLSHACPPFLHQRGAGSPDSHPSEGHLLATPRQRSLVLGWFHPEALPLCPNDAHLFPGIRPFPTLDPNSPSSGMGRGPSRPEGETLLKEAGRGWRGRECPPVEGFSSWRKDRGGGQRQRWPVPSPPPTSSRE